MDPVFSRVRHGHEDGWFDQTLLRQALGRFVGIPFHTGEGSGGVEHVLAVLEIEHRKTPS